MAKKIQIVDEAAYVNQFTKDPGNTNSTPGIPLRVYDIQTASQQIKTPTRLFRPTFNSISIIKKGYLKTRLDNEIWQVTKNTLLISRSGHISATLGFSKNVEGYFVIYDDEALNTLFSKNEFLSFFSNDPFIRLTTSDTNWLCDLISLIESEVTKKDGSIDVAFPLFQAIYRKLFSLNPPTRQINDRSTNITFSFKELCHQHHIKEKNIDFYSKKLAVSNNYLTRCIKTSTGLTPKLILNKCDIEHAKLLLQDHSKSLADIAIELNFNDPSYLSRLFKKITGVTATQYRIHHMHY